jgi:hypothetical protein
VALPRTPADTGCPRADDAWACVTTEQELKLAVVAAVVVVDGTVLVDPAEVVAGCVGGAVVDDEEDAEPHAVIRLAAARTSIADRPNRLGGCTLIGPRDRSDGPCALRP